MTVHRLAPKAPPLRIASENSAGNRAIEQRDAVLLMIHEDPEVMRFYGLMRHIGIDLAACIRDGKDITEMTLARYRRHDGSYDTARAENDVRSYRNPQFRTGN